MKTNWLKMVNQNQNCVKWSTCISACYFIQGGVAFTLIKGVLKIYYKQQQYLRQANRVILDFPTEEKETPQSATSSWGQPMVRPACDEIDDYFQSLLAWLLTYCDLHDSTIFFSYSLLKWGNMKFVKDVHGYVMHSVLNRLCLLK